MCGILAVFNFDYEQAVDKAMVRMMTDTMMHRGPDNEGYLTMDNIGLGHRRLSIIDLSDSGRQPMCNEDRTVWVTYNGEIYNFKSLRKALIREGHIFRTATDTEVILHGYEQYGLLGCLKQLRGMFAFALWDSWKKELFVVRDRLGIKPLIYTVTPDRFIAASEIRAILADKTIERALNLEALHHYLSFLNVPAPFTIYKNIFKLLPGHYLIVKKSGVEIHRYWDLVYEQVGGRSVDFDYEGELESLLFRAVKEHLVSDVPIGSFLSGGVDSSTITALATKCSSEPLKTFSVSFDGNCLDESPFARRVSEYLGTKAYTINFQPNYVNMLSKIQEDFGEPFAITSAFPLLKMAQFAKQHVKVVLTGDGADETFAGYTYRHNRHWRVQRLLSILPSFFCKFLALAFDQKAGWESSAGLFARIKRRASQIASLAEADPMEAYCNSLCYVDEHSKQGLYTEDVRKSLTGCNSITYLKNMASPICGEDLLWQWLYLDIKTILPDEMLAKVERTTMAVGLEARVPFLDHEIVEYAMTIPRELKMKGKEGKVILKRIMERYLPKDILYRPKQGFSVPIADWFRGELYDYARTCLTKKKLERQGLFDPSAVDRILTTHKEKPGIDNSMQINALICIELWMQSASFD